MKNKIILHKNIIAYICLVHFLINVKIYCKTESNFFIMFSMVGRIWIRDGPHAGRWLRTNAQDRGFISTSLGLLLKILSFSH